MTEDHHKKANSLYDLMFKRHFEITYRVVYLTLLPLLLFGALGYALDSYFAIKPIGIIAGITMGFIAAQVLIFFTFMSLTKKTNGRSLS